MGITFQFQMPRKQRANMKEEWKDIRGYEGRYQISNLGNVKSLNYANTGRQKLLHPSSHHLGYLIVRLVRPENIRPENKMVHTLVASAFIPNSSNKPCVNHIDGNKQNNVVTNLEWVTHKENMEHAITTGLRNPHFNNKPLGDNNPSRKPILQFTKNGDFVKRWECISEASRYMKCTPAQITNNAKGRNKTCHGFVWRYPNA